MTVFTLDDLRRILRACAGEEDSVDLDADIHDATFGELGYDSWHCWSWPAGSSASTAPPSRTTRRSG